VLLFILHELLKLQATYPTAYYPIHLVAYLTAIAGSVFNQRPAPDPPPIIDDSTTTRREKIMLTKQHQQRQILKLFSPLALLLLLLPGGSNGQGCSPVPDYMDD